LEEKNKPETSSWPKVSTGSDSTPRLWEISLASPDVEEAEGVKTGEGREEETEEGREEEGREEEGREEVETEGIGREGRADGGVALALATEETDCGAGENDDDGDEEGDNVVCGRLSRWAWRCSTAKETTF
jgi:hypothetical protein